MGKESFLVLHLHESRLLTSQGFILEQHSAVWLLTYSACIAHDTHVSNHIWHHKIIRHGNNKAVWWRQMAPVGMCIFTYPQPSTSLFTCSTAFLWNIRHCPYLSLLSLHICIYLLHHLYLWAFFLSPALPLFLSLTIAYKVSLQNTNVLQSPWKQWEQRDRPGTVREFIWCWHRCQMHSLLVHVWHMRGTCSKVCFWSP